MSITYQVILKSDKIFYLPDDFVIFNVLVKNNGNSTIRIKDFVLKFTNGFNVNLSNLDFILYPKTDNLFSDSSAIKLNNQYGNQQFRLCYNIYLFNNNWNLYDQYESQQLYFFNVVTKRELSSGQFVIFLSRGRLPEDREIGDIIKIRLKEWNIDTKTVGIDIDAPDEQTVKVIRKEIMESDGLIAIATHRNYDILTKTWQTLEWLHAELGIAFAIDKPLLIINENNTPLKGLPSYLVNHNNIPSFNFDRNDKQNLIINIDNHMPPFKEWLKKYRDKQFFDSITEFGKISLAIIGGIVVAKNIFDGFDFNSQK